jgi:hypothetical protein
LLKYVLKDCEGEGQDVRVEVLEEEAHRGHAAAGARLQREENHDELQTPFHCQVGQNFSYLISLLLFYSKSK